ncbi:MAG: ECF-type sigma factor [Candidatus Eisenbacteria bacterium]
MTQPGRVTELLISVREGNRDALDELVPLVHAELRKIARAKLKRERVGHSLDTAGLVNEAYLRLVQAERLSWESRAHFLAIAAQVMRNILVNHVHRRNRRKRGGGVGHMPLDEAVHAPGSEDRRILDLDRALDELAILNPRHARVVECRFFGGMTIEETAAALEISTATAKRDWAVLRLWLQHQLERQV